MPWAANRTSPPSALCLDGVFCPRKSPLGLTYEFFCVYSTLHKIKNKRLYENNPSKLWDTLIPLCNYVCTRQKDHKLGLQNWCMGMGYYDARLYDRWRYCHLFNNSYAQKDWKNYFFNWVAMSKWWYYQNQWKIHH